MEWKPREIEEHSLWEIAAYAEGLHRANGGAAKQEPMSNDEFDSLLEMHSLTPGHA